MDDKVTIPVAARRINRTPAALYSAAKNKQLATSMEYGVMVVSMEEARRYKRDTKAGPRSKNGKPTRKK